MHYSTSILTDLKQKIRCAEKSVHRIFLFLFNYASLTVVYGKASCDPVLRIFDDAVKRIGENVGRFRVSYKNEAV